MRELLVRGKNTIDPEVIGPGGRSVTFTFPWKLVADLLEFSGHALGTTGLKECLDVQFSLHSVLKGLDLILVKCGVGTDSSLKHSVIKSFPSVWLFHTRYMLFFQYTCVCRI
jgi:hypothetical protein